MTSMRSHNNKSAGGKQNMYSSTGYNMRGASTPANVIKVDRNEPPRTGDQPSDRQYNAAYDPQYIHVSAINQASINRTPTSSIPQPGRIMSNPFSNTPRTQSNNLRNMSIDKSESEHIEVAGFNEVGMVGGHAKTPSNMASSRSLFGKGKAAIFG